MTGELALTVAVVANAIAVLFLTLRFEVLRRTVLDLRRPRGFRRGVGCGYVELASDGSWWACTRKHTEGHHHMGVRFAKDGAVLSEDT